MTGLILDAGALVAIDRGDRVVHEKIKRALRSGQPVLIFLRIDELQGIGGYQALIEFFEFSIIEQQRQTRPGVQPFMVAALRANLVIVL